MVCPQISRDAALAELLISTNIKNTSSFENIIPPLHASLFVDFLSDLNILDPICKSEKDNLVEYNFI